MNQVTEGGEGGGSTEPVQTPLTATDPAPATDPWTKTIPDDWREQLAAGDEKKLNMLKRITDFDKFTESYFNAQDKIRAGEVSNGLPDNPTEEQIAAYREANGIPKSAEEYSLTLEDGLVLGDLDEKVMGAVYEAAHKNNISNEAISDLTNAMLKGREYEAQALIKQDGLDVQQSKTMLRQTWGQDYETNIGLVQGILKGLPDSVRDQFANARLSDGTAVFNSPEMMNFFAEAARAINPAATVVPAGNGNPMQAITGRIEQLEGMMGEPNWHKNASAQKELLDLYTARDKMK